MVIPEVLTDGTHGLTTSAAVTERILRELHLGLSQHEVVLEATLLKSNMVVPGATSGVDADEAEIAEATIEVSAETVPDEIYTSSKPAHSDRDPPTRSS